MFCFIKKQKSTAHIVFLLFLFPSALLAAVVVVFVKHFFPFPLLDQELKSVILLLFAEFCVCLPGAGARLKF